MGDAPSELEARIEDGAGGGAKAGGEVDFAKVPVEEAFKTLNVSHCMLCSNAVAAGGWCGPHGACSAASS